MIFQGHSRAVNTGHVENQSYDAEDQSQFRTLFEGQSQYNAYRPNNRNFLGQRQGQSSDNVYCQDNGEVHKQYQASNRGQTTYYDQGYGKTKRQEQRGMRVSSLFIIY